LAITRRLQLQLVRVVQRKSLKRRAGASVRWKACSAAASSLSISHYYDTYTSASWLSSIF
jgi:hypothetical protein